MRFSDILIGGSSYAAYKRQTLSLKALSAHPLICLGRGTMTYDFYEHFYRRHGLVFEPDEQLPEREIFLIESRSHPLSTAAQAFKALVLSPRHAGD